MVVSWFLDPSMDLQLKDKKEAYQEDSSAAKHSVTTHVFP